MSKTAGELVVAAREEGRIEERKRCIRLLQEMALEFRRSGLFHDRPFYEVLWKASEALK